MDNIIDKEDGNVEMLQGEQEGSRDESEEILAPQLEQWSHQLLTSLNQLRQDFETKLMYDASKERQIDGMHQELQEYREGLHFRLLRPMFLDLIAMYDDLGKLAESLTTGGAVPDIERIGKNLRSFQDTLLEILQRQGVEAFSVEDETFAGGRQRAIKIVETDDFQLDKKIARRSRQGFEYEGKVLRPEWVEVYKYMSVQ